MSECCGRLCTLCDIDVPEEYIPGEERVLCVIHNVYMYNIGAYSINYI
jgi:hypothetical protein